MRRAAVILAFAGFSTAWGQVDTAKFPEIRVPAVAVDASGAALPLPTPEALVVKENGHVQKVTAVTPAEEPQSVCILVDLSTTVRTRVDILKMVTARLLRGLRPTDEVCLAEFSTTMEIDRPLAPLNEDRGDFGKALGKMSIGSSGPLLYDSVIKLGESMQKTATHPSRVMIVVSDVDDKDSHASIVELRQRMQQPGMPAVFVLRLPVASDSGGLGHYAEDGEPTYVTNATGGIASYPHDLRELGPAMDKLLAATRSLFWITYTSDNASKDGKGRKLEVSLDKAHQKAKAVVKAPERYYAISR